MQRISIAVVFVSLFLSTPNSRAQPAPPAGSPTPAADGATAASPSPTPGQSKEELEAEIAKELGTTQATPSPTPPPAIARAGSLRLIDISFDALFAGGFSSADESEIQVLQGGGHDPKQNGFTVQNVEVSFLGAVDPYLRGEAHVVFQLDPEGETNVELEEAFLTTQTLPHGLQLKAGQFFTEIGRLNPTHPHTWHFVDQPVINSRMFGEDGLRGPGLRMSWLTPLPWYSELLGSVQNARGETQFSFLSNSNEGEFSGFPFVDHPVDGPGDLLYSLRTLNSFTLSEATTLNVGASAAFGPNPTGPDNRTTILGADLYLRWQRPMSYQGYPFVAWQTEYFHRSYEAGAAPDSVPGAVTEDLTDDGIYSQIAWGYKRGWVAAARVDYANGNGDPTDPLRDRRLRLSADLTYYPTEFSKVRAQYNLDRAEHLDDELQSSVWLQFEFLLGAHGSHKF